MSIFLKKLKDIRWNRGAAELIGFALILPCIAIILFSVITIFQVCLARQTLEHTTYMAGRAAVVCETYQSALSQAQATARSTLADSTIGVNPEDVTVSLDLVGGTSNATGSGITWEKGALVKCTVKIKIDEIMTLGSGSDGTMESTIYIMVERPARTYY